MNKEIKLEVLLFLFAGICCFYLIPEFTPDVPSANDLGPRMFPRLSMAVVGLSALGLIVNSFRQKTKTEDKQEKTNNRYLAAFVGVFIYVLAVAFVGFYCSSFLFTAVYFRKLPRKAYLFNLAILIPIFACIWFLFEKMMMVPLPSGILF